MSKKLPFRELGRRAMLSGAYWRQAIRMAKTATQRDVLAGEIVVALYSVRKERPTKEQKERPTMSIEMNNPETVYEKLDAAANYVAQARLAFSIGDRAHVEKSLAETERLLFVAMEQIEEGEKDQP